MAALVLLQPRCPYLPAARAPPLRRTLSPPLPLRCRAPATTAPQVVAIHSDIPDEEQAEAFRTGGGQVKVVVATNAAESSITVPDVDSVICLGVHKQVRRAPDRLADHCSLAPALCGGGGGAGSGAREGEGEGSAVGTETPGGRVLSCVCPTPRLPPPAPASFFDHLARLPRLVSLPPRPFASLGFFATSPVCLAYFFATPRPFASLGFFATSLDRAGQIEYNAASHRTMLSPLWISRASAVQRAGRTGRTRPGTVYRLYSRRLFESKMEAFDSGEMGRQPLDGVILRLRTMLGGPVVPVLEDVLTPPPLEHVGAAFGALHGDGFIDSPGDEGALTSLGSFVAGLGLDLRLGRCGGWGGGTWVERRELRRRVLGGRAEATLSILQSHLRLSCTKALTAIGLRTNVPPLELWSEATPPTHKRFWRVRKPPGPRKEEHTAEHQ